MRIKEHHTLPPSERPLRDLEPAALTVDQFCKFLNIGRTSAYELIGAKKVRSIVIAGRRLIPVSEGRRLIAEALAADEGAA
jgi:hypothetical protein